MCVSFPLLLHSHALTMGGFRRGKYFFEPCTINVWAIVIYESPSRFNLKAAREMALGFCNSARSVGKWSCIHALRYAIAYSLGSQPGITLKDLTPLLFWENGNGNITEVNINDCCLLFLRKSIISFTLALEESCKSLC